jgi:5,10-methylenetetrahydrofolate reductase
VASSRLLATMAERPVVVTDLRVRPFDPASIAAVAGTLAGASDAVLVGEHQSRPDFPASVMADLARRAGAQPWVTLSCRDRNAVVLQSELAALAALGVDGVHCVTGDARGPATATGATQVFDLDALQLTALAARSGLVASVAATPVAPPRDQRPLRTLDKQRAGASFAFVNHAGEADAVARFVAASRQVGCTMPFVACVAVFTDATSAAVLDAFPGLELDRHMVERVLSASDPVQAGIEAAVVQAEEMLAIEGVCGVNLSGSATAGPEDESAAIMATIGHRLLGRVP